MNRKLSRSRSDSLLAGVCGGLGSYLDIDSTLIRLLFVLLSLSGGAGMLLYLACWLVMPLESDLHTLRENIHDADRQNVTHSVDQHETWLIGGALLVAGCLLMVQSIGWMGGMHMHMVWSLALVALGLLLVVRH